MTRLRLSPARSQPSSPLYCKNVRPIGDLAQVYSKIMAMSRHVNEWINAAPRISGEE